MRSLQNIILSNLPYSQLYGICADSKINHPLGDLSNDRDNRVRGVLECDNLADSKIDYPVGNLSNDSKIDYPLGNLSNDRDNIWKNKALAEFNVPPAFFDLALQGRSVVPSPSQRYVEIATYFTLQPFSQAVLENGEIGTQACIEATEKRDDRMTEHFYSLLSHSKKIYVKDQLLDTRMTDFATRLICGIPVEDKPYLREEDANILSTVIKTGNLALLNRQLELEGITPSSFRIEDYIPELEFDPQAETFALSPLPLYRKPLHQIRVMNSAIYSCNPRIVDFFRSYFNLDRPNTGYRSLLAGYKRHHKPVQAYSILQRISTTKTATFNILETGNLDLALLQMSRVGSCDLDYFSYLPGNLPLLLALLPYCLKGEERPRSALTILLNKTPFSFPLTREVISYAITLL